MALYYIHRDTAIYKYAWNWANSHNWELAYKSKTTYNADDQCCGQTYLELYKLDTSGNPDSLAKKMGTVKYCLDYNIKYRKNRDWTWIDAIQMSMPIYALMGQITGDTAYYDYMYRSYKYTRDSLDVIGTYNPDDGFWWRDKDFNAPYLNSNDKQVYWSRGVGWVYAALTRVLNTIPVTESHYDEYLSDYLSMSQALVACQREDGFWNPNLGDPDDYGGKETSGTSLFVFGLAWGLNNDILDRETYLSAVKKGWTALGRDAVHPNGFLGWMQGTGKQPSDGQPLSYDKVPNFEDYGAGCVLLAAAESYKLAKTIEKEDSLQNALNPLKPATTIRLIHQADHLQIYHAEAFGVIVYDATGRCRHETQLSDKSPITIETSGWPEGVYLIRIEGNHQVQTLKYLK
jgi:rhamnogalacturonyl hydrolase YesR